MKKLIITTIIGTVVYFTVAWVIFEFILGNYTNLHTTQLSGFKKTTEQSSLGLLILSCASYAALMSFILVYLQNIKNLKRSFLVGSTIGTLVAVMTDTYWYATSNFYSNFLVIFFDIFGAGVSVGIMCLAVTLTNQKLDRERILPWGIMLWNL